jgi:hypothetical protein
MIFFFIFNGIIDKKYIYKLKDNIFNKNDIDFYLTNSAIYTLVRIFHNILYKLLPSLNTFV